MIAPISKKVLEPVFLTNIEYVDSIEEFEKIELEPNQKILKFDNYKNCFYIKGRNALGEYSQINIYFYETFVEKIKDIEREEFVKKCKEVGYDDVKSEVACKFFLENKKPQDVWLWLLENKIKDWSWDYVTSLRCSMKKKLFNNLTKT